MIWKTFAQAKNQEGWTDYIRSLWILKTMNKIKTSDKFKKVYLISKKSKSQIVDNFLSVVMQSKNKSSFLISHLIMFNITFVQFKVKNNVGAQGLKI